ncbi:hypothetical protein A2U01_0021903 [Trifolium medium]|uniref:Uncharacterized protein n=1 Tax=Trifolium medium TaxID=97028 RepID=A0A392NP36_9FABA|nr:hypothetical protein [Trifolium medium]
MGRGKKQASYALVEQPAKKQKNAKGAKSKLEPGGTSQASQPPPPIPQAPILQGQVIPIERRFKSEIAFQRYAQINTFNFQQEKGISMELLRVVPEIYGELRRRE